MAGATVVEGLLLGGSWRISYFGASGDFAFVLAENDGLGCSTIAGLFGLDSFLSLPGTDLRGGGYVSPRASAAAFRRSVSALLGRPRFLGGSFPARFSKLEGKWADAPLSLLNEPALAGGRG